METNHLTDSSIKSSTTSFNNESATSVTKSLLKRYESRNRPKGLSLHDMAKSYLNDAKNLIEEETKKTVLVIENLGDQLDQVKLPIIKSPDTVSSLVNVGGVLKKEWPFFTCDTTPFSQGKYKAKDFHLPTLRKSRSSSRLPPLNTNTGRTSVLSWLGNYANTEAIEQEKNERGEISENHIKKRNIQRFTKGESNEKIEESNKSGYQPTFESTIITERDAIGDDSVEYNERQYERKKTMKLIKCCGAKVPEGLYGSLLRRKLLLEEMKKGNRNLEKLPKVVNQEILIKHSECNFDRHFFLSIRQESYEYPAQV